MRELVNDFGHKIADSFTENSYCHFAPPEETLGYIDTSVKRSGKHGIAFLCDEIVVCLKGNAQRVQYRNIRNVTIGGSLDPYDDELTITANNDTIHITHEYFNKLFLKQLIDNLCRTYNFMTERQREDMYSECTSIAMSHFTEEVTEPQKTVKVVKVVSRVKTVKASIKPSATTANAENKAPATSAPAPIDEGDAVTWSLSQDNSDKADATIDKPQKDKTIIPAPDAPKPAPIDESDTVTWSLSREQTAAPVIDDVASSDEDIDGMTKAQTMSYLLDSINEINSDSDDTPSESEPIQQPYIAPQPSQPPVAESNNVIPQSVQQETVAPVADVTPAPEPLISEQPKPEPIPSPYTTEPESFDIYLQASARIREMYENGSLTPELVEQELKTNLISTAEDYTRIMESGKPIPPLVTARAALLKDATDRLSEYFALGEDIGSRVMLFMMFQMLSYIDRIEETPESKEKLNEFFKRCGSAGIVLSMIDSM